MITRILTADDYEHLVEMARSFNGGDVPTDGPQVTYDSKWLAAWLAAMQKWYLGYDDKHFIIGHFNDDGVLTAVLAARTDLLEPYTGVLYVGHFKTHRSFTIASKNGAFEIWKFLSKWMKDHKVERWMYLVRSSKIAQYEKFFSKVDDSLNNDWTFTKVAEILPHVRPEEEWIWQIMGRGLFDTHWEIRLAERKHD